MRYQQSSLLSRTVMMEGPPELRADGRVVLAQIGGAALGPL